MTDAVVTMTVAEAPVDVQTPVCCVLLLDDTEVGLLMDDVNVALLETTLVAGATALHVEYPDLM